MYDELVKELRESPANKRLMIYAADAIEFLNTYKVCFENLLDVPTIIPASKEE